VGWSMNTKGDALVLEDVNDKALMDLVSLIAYGDNAYYLPNRATLYVLLFIFHKEIKI
jgi:hypothetical protein